jgi:hypothetical protein
MERDPFFFNLPFLNSCTTTPIMKCRKNNAAVKYANDHPEDLDYGGYVNNTLVEKRALIVEEIELLEKTLTAKSKSALAKQIAELEKQVAYLKAQRDLLKSTYREHRSFLRKALKTIPYL